MEDKKKASGSNSKILVIIIAILAVVLIGVVLFFVLNGKNDNNKEEETSRSSGLQYEAHVITDDPEKLQDAVEKLYEKAKEGQMTLSMKNQAVSTDGINFACYLGNDIKNNYDMYMVLYRDDTQEEIFRSGLIPIGSRIEEFQVTKKIEPGTYEGTLVYNQVEEDKETIHAQVNVGLTLIVEE